jgi:hypothetical protein
MALAALGVIVAHALGRRAAARLGRLPIERIWLRLFVRLPGPGRSGARLGAVAAGTVAAYLAAARIAATWRASSSGAASGAIIGAGTGCTWAAVRRSGRGARRASARGMRR